MDALAVVEYFDVVEDFGARLEVRGEGPPIDQLEFEGAPEAFHGVVVLAVSASAHGGGETCLDQGGPEGVGGILAPPIGMEEQTGRGMAMEQRHGEGP